MERLPIDRKKLSGTLRPDRESQGIEIEAGSKLSEAPPARAGLSDLARAHWDELAPLAVSMEILTPADLPLLKLACKTLATADELEAAITKEGFTIACATGGRKAHPAMKALETARNAAHRMLNDFGLSPKARKFVSKAPGRQSESRYAQFKKNPYLSLDE
jgi:P27 family predicted phage terminase small subunit